MRTVHYFQDYSHKMKILVLLFLSVTSNSAQSYAQSPSYGGNQPSSVSNPQGNQATASSSYAKQTSSAGYQAAASSYQKQSPSSAGLQPAQQLSPVGFQPAQAGVLAGPQQLSQLSLQAGFQGGQVPQFQGGQQFGQLGSQQFAQGGQQSPLQANGPYSSGHHNCSIESVVQVAEVCTPTLQSSCEKVSLPVKQIVDGVYCYDEVSTVCTETTETIDNEVCEITYSEQVEDAVAETVSVTFQRKSYVQPVTVCNNGYGSGNGNNNGYGSGNGNNNGYGSGNGNVNGYGSGNNGYGNANNGYGNGYGSGSDCQDVSQETLVNEPVLVPETVPVRVSFPSPSRSCSNVPISLPRVSCSNQVQQRCVSQPELKDSAVTVEVCFTVVGAPNCQKGELVLPQQVCQQYGYSEGQAGQAYQGQYKPKNQQQASYP